MTWQTKCKHRFDSSQSQCFVVFSCHLYSSGSVCRRLISSPVNLSEDVRRTFFSQIDLFVANVELANGDISKKTCTKKGILNSYTWDIYLHGWAYMDSQLIMHVQATLPRDMG